MDEELEVDPWLLLGIFRFCWFSPTAAEPGMFFFLPLHDEQNTRRREIVKDLVSIFTASKYDFSMELFEP